MDQASSVARSAAGRLIAHETNTHEPTSAADPVLGAIQRATFELSRWVGTSGCNALLARAVNRAAQAHPILTGIISADSNAVPVLAGLAESTPGDRASAVSDALTATLIEFFELLIRLIGEELTIKLTEQIMGPDSLGIRQREAERENE